MKTKTISRKRVRGQVDRSPLNATQKKIEARVLEYYRQKQAKNVS